MKIEFNLKKGFSFLTDNTKEVDTSTLFLKTYQNSNYFNTLENKPLFIDVKELIELWKIKNIKIVGVTGTNGKTTVTAGIYSLLLDLNESVALQGTRGLFVNEKNLEDKKMTTPSIFETLYNIKRALDLKANFFIMEVSSHAIIQKRIEELNFALKVHTNVTSDHLDYHKTVEEYRRVKSLFFEDDTLKLLNKDEIKNIRYNPKNAFSYGVDEPASFKVQAFSLNNGIIAQIKNLKDECTFSSPMVGLFNLFNLMAIIGSTKLLTDKPLNEICKAVEYFGGVAGRMEVVNKEPLIIVDFAHTDDGIEKVLESMKDKKLVVVFGAGGNRDKSKRPKMGRVVGKYASKIYVTSDNPRDEIPEMILEDILVGLKGKEDITLATPDREMAIKIALARLQKDEVLLILGKGDEDYQEIKGVKHPFDDRKIVKKLLKEIKTQ